MDYSDSILNALKSEGIKIGDHVIVEKDVHRFEGILMPKSQGSSNIVIIKLRNGYNIGIEFKGATIKKAPGERDAAVIGKKYKKTQNEKYRADSSRRTVAILTTGGTIASRIDYKTGAVISLDTPEELLEAMPELRNLINIRTRKIFQMPSDDMQSEHWCMLARKIEDEINSGSDGVIITHGTDTMHYTSAALSFMVQNSPIPILLVGSQRSSDRGSSDAAMNMLCAAHFIAKSDFSGVAVCMHGSSDDLFCYIHEACNVRKMHSSRRDAFRSVDVMPIAHVEMNGMINYIRNDYQKKDASKKPKIFDRFEKNVALVKIYPGFDYRILEYYESIGTKGIVLEGTGLGHAPITETDDATKNHPKLLETIKRMSGNGIIIGMTTQCIYGKVNMNVYSPGRILQGAGVIALPMIPETALVKMGWAIGNSKSVDDAKRLLQENISGEIVDRIDYRCY